jgi:hypothetical protein
VTELAQRMAAWEEEYTLGRPHLSLKGQTPAEAPIKADTEEAKTVQDVFEQFHVNDLYPLGHWQYRVPDAIGRNSDSVQLRS